MEESKPNEGYSAGLVICDLCTHEWFAVRPCKIEKLECPNCGNICSYEEKD